jgi:YD repeat-containing protein
MDAAKERNALNNATFTYDAAGSKLSQTDAKGNTTK